MNTKKIPIRKRGIPEPKWFEKEMTDADFDILTDGDGKFFLRHKAWKEHVMAGPYDDKGKVLEIIKEYIKNSKRKPTKKKPIPDLHSYLADDVSRFKVV